MLYIYGATAHAKVAVEMAEELRIKVLGLIDKSLIIQDVFNYEVKLQHHSQNPDERFFIAIHNSGLRQRIVSENSQWNYISMIHPKSFVSKRAEIGLGTIILPGAYIAADVQIGHHCIIGANAVIESNTIIEDFVNIGANSTIGSHVLIGRSSEINANIYINPETTIAKESYVEL